MGILKRTTKKILEQPFWKADKEGDPLCVFTVSETKEHSANRIRLQEGS